MYGKRHELLQAATQLFAAEGFGVSTAKIAGLAGVANGTLFTYFPTKQELVDALYLDLKKEVMVLFAEARFEEDADLREVSARIWDKYVRWALAAPAKHAVMNLLKSGGMLSPSVVAEADDMFKPMSEIIMRGIKSGLLTVKDVMYLQLLMAAQIEASIGLARLNNLKGKALDEHVQAGFRIFWKGVTT